MAKGKYMTGQEFVDKCLSREVKFHPIAVRRAKKLAKEIDKVMKVHPKICSVAIDSRNVFCFEHVSHFHVPSAAGATAVFKLRVVRNPMIIQTVMHSCGFDCINIIIKNSIIADDYYSIGRKKED